MVHCRDVDMNISDEEMSQLKVDSKIKLKLRKIFVSPDFIFALILSAFIEISLLQLSEDTSLISDWLSLFLSAGATLFGITIAIYILLITFPSEQIIESMIESDYFSNTIGTIVWTVIVMTFTIIFSILGLFSMGINYSIGIVCLSLTLFYFIYSILILLLIGSQTFLHIAEFRIIDTKISILLKKKRMGRRKRKKR